MPSGLVYDPIFLQHLNPQGHPERVQRLEAICRNLADSGDWDRLQAVTPADAEHDLLELVHEPAYVDALDKVSGQDGYLDADTYLSPESVHAAYRAAGSAAALARQVYDGSLRNGIALLRPPGHHAEAGRAMGFCLLNNVAVAAADLIRAGAKRVAIYDWDVHHGNGTQHSFEADPRVLYLSTHQFPFYPGTGAATEVGRGEGKGATVNIPLPAGCGDAEYLAALDIFVLPIIEQFQPDVILISAGFDSYVSDPLASMLVSADGFRQMARRMRALADRVCQGRIVYLLEGGYDLDGLSLGVAACVNDLLEPAAPEPPATPTLSQWDPVRDKVIKVQKEFWRL